MENNFQLPIRQFPVDFAEAIRRGFENYCNFSGRASRSEYWYWVLFAFLLSIAAGFLDGFLGLQIGEDQVGILTTLLSLALLLPSLGLAWRRLHDIGRAGGWYFINLIPVVGSIIFIIWAAQPSEMQPNRFGDVPNVR